MSAKQRDIDQQRRKKRPRPNHIPETETRELTVIKWVTRCLAIGALALAALRIWEGDSAGGAVAGAIAFGLALFQYFPLVSEVSGFGVLVKIEREVEAATRTLNELRSVAKVFAQTTMTGLAGNGRWGGQHRDVINAQAQSIDELLDKLDISESERADIKEPYLNSVAFDIHRVIISFLGEFFGEFNRSLAMIGLVHQEGDERQAEWDKRQNDARIHNHLHFGIGIDDRARLQTLHDEIANYLSQFTIPPIFLEKILSEAKKAEGLIADVYESGAQTDESMSYLGHYVNTATLFQEVFGPLIEESRRDK